MTSELHYDPELHNALWSVGEDRVVHHSGYGAHPEGWAWIDGAHMSPEMETHLDVLRHAHLIGWVGASKSLGNIVCLTPESGVGRLNAWNSAHPMGVVA